MARPHRVVIWCHVSPACSVLRAIKVEVEAFHGFVLRGEYVFENGAYLFAAPSYSNLEVKVYAARDRLNRLQGRLPHWSLKPMCKFFYRASGSALSGRTFKVPTSP